MIISQLLAVNPAAVAKLKAKDRKVVFEAIRVRVLDSAEIRGLAKQYFKKTIR
jgi:hypothetical protein